MKKMKKNDEMIKMIKRNETEMKNETKKRGIHKERNSITIFIE